MTQQEQWTDERIREAMLRRVSHQHYMTIYDARMVAHEMRDDMQQRLAAVSAERDAAQQEVARLTRRVAILEGEPVESEYEGADE